MGVSKVVYGDDTLVDLTGDTVTPTSLTLGATAHAANGEPIVGEYQYVLPPMSSDIRGGARIQPDSGLEITDTDNLQVRLALESDGTVRGGLAEVTAKGHAEQFSTTGKNLFDPNGVEVNGYLNNGKLVTDNVNKGVAILIEPNTTYTLQGTIVNTSSTSDNWHVGEFDTMPTNGSVALKNYVLDAATINKTFTTDANAHYLFVKYCNINRSNPEVTKRTIQLELGSTATEYEPYTGGAPSPSPDYPQEIQVVRGRNLIPAVESGVINSTNGNYADNSTCVRTQKIPVVSGATYTLSLSKSYDGSAVTIVCWNEDGTFNSRLYSGGASTKHPVATVTIPAGVNRVAFTAGSSSNPATPSTVTNVQLTLGSTPQPYVPYGHVGMEVRDPDTDELISCTALPLPQRGWVAGLPDGTADSLRLDGAGKCEWTEQTNETVLNGTETWFGTDVYFKTRNDMKRLQNYKNSLMASSLTVVENSDLVSTGNRISGRHGTDYPGYNWIYAYTTDTNVTDATSFAAWLSTHPVTVLYPLATPVTEDCGYVEDWPTDLPEGAVITIPELDAVGIKYFVDSTVTELAKQWYARANSEYADRITALEQAVAELATS